MVRGSAEGRRLRESRAEAAYCFSSRIREPNQDAERGTSKDLTCARHPRTTAASCPSPSNRVSTTAWHQSEEGNPNRCHVDKSAPMLLQLHALISRVSAGGPAGPETRRFANTVRQYCFVNSSMIWLGEAKPPKIASTRRGSFGSMHSCLCGLLRLFLNVPGPNDKASALGLAAAVVAWGHLKSNRKNITVQQFNLRSSLTPLRIELIYPRKTNMEILACFSFQRPILTPQF